jgi:hypothetical protein
MNTILIGGVYHPLFFNMRAIENVMAEFDLSDFTALGENMSSNNIAHSLKFARACAYYGIQSGYKKQGGKFPFVDIDDFADAIESFHEIEPVIVMFTKAIEEFFKPRQGVGIIHGDSLEKIQREIVNP